MKPSRRAVLQALGAAGLASRLRGDSSATISAVQVGDVVPGRALLWARAPRPSRLHVEWATTDKFTNTRTISGPFALEDSDLTARLDLTGLPAGQEIFYRVRFEDLRGGMRSEPLTGRFRTTPADRRNVRVVWGGDVVGQGWGINPEWGGLRIFDTMRQRQPDLFLHSGDTIYADGPLPREVKLPDGSLWRNVVTEEKSKVAETLDEFRGCHRYNLLDEHVRRLGSEVAQVWQWDDHEVLNNWSSSKDLTKTAAFTEKSVPLLVARGARAFHEYAPIRRTPEEPERVYRHIPYGPLLDVFVIDMRSYRGPNSPNRQRAESAETAFLGREQFAWLLDGLKRSRAVWKVIQSDMPIGLGVPDGRNAQGEPLWEAIANGEGGPAAGRELEIARLLQAMKDAKVRNTVWVTADVHYTAAHHYSPARARFTEFDPFWEFVSGPLHAGTFGPGQLDGTFGPEAVFVKAPPQGQANLAPSAGYQFFGELEIEGKTGELTVTLRDVAGAALWQKRLAAV